MDSNPPTTADFAYENAQHGAADFKSFRLRINNQKRAARDKLASLPNYTDPLSTNELYHVINTLWDAIEILSAE